MGYESKESFLVPTCFEERRLWCQSGLTGLVWGKEMGIGMGRSGNLYAQGKEEGTAGVVDAPGCLAT